MQKIIETINTSTESVTLRVLSFRSSLRFGKYEGVPISDLISFGKSKYLRWVYFNIGGISFTEDVLRAIYIVGDTFDNRISKPGTDIELSNEDDKRMFKLICGKNSFFFAKNKSIKVLRRNNINDAVRDRIHYSPSAMTRRNHGH